ncbi:D-alanine--D-alanine ligase family protein [Nocardioides sp. SOB44]|jgi:D-alanine-D-alanine ligase|uniref:D-alanine--D-alanine ligase n=1 Tax=Nocardioides cremeus TaxID=3058044 RepID=A0ABT8TLT1_9ACTN|nr:D-alanine--D-alanine ligase family protein [Nocardioides cremeus]MDO3394928.1 D-alanine--D-alanine ligase family protein [Nocardioides cremeus]
MTETPSPETRARRTRVALVFGGRSGEHPISAATAAGVMRAIDSDKYDVLPIGITRDGDWVLASGDPAQWELASGRLPEVTTGSGPALASLTEAGPVDVVFPLLHGPYGEDGTIQGLLELAGVRYVGAGVLASAVGMDKHYMKLVFAGHGLPVAPYVVVRPAEWEQDPGAVVERVQQALEFPVFVKPARAGSSLGVTRVDDLTGLADAVEEARAHDPKVLVEQGVEGREIECAVLGGRGGGPARASVPGEIVVDHGAATFYDFEAKYLSDSHARTEAPADLPADVAERVREVAVQAFDSISAEGLSRVDVFVTPEGEVLLNEINTMPGFTPISMYSKMWEATGLTYTELVDELIQLALERTTGLR